MKTIILNVIKFYKLIFSNVVHSFLGSRFAGCRFYPSCSEYSKEAITRFGLKSGLSKSIYRILRCNPISKGGFDPVI